MPTRSKVIVASARLAADRYEASIVPRRNNAIATAVFIALVFLAAIPTDWLTISKASSGIVTVTGLTGHLTGLHMASLPIWVLLCGSAALTLVAGLNYLRATTVPFLPLAAALVAGGVYYLLPFLIRDDPMQGTTISMGAGPFLAEAATFAATLLALRRPLPVPLSRSTGTPSGMPSRNTLAHR